jgi:type I protein arginine methyltransferase
MYSLVTFGNMLRDKIRADAYAEALRRVVMPDSVVIDLGSGPGAFAVLACKLGARKVYAIDPNPVVQLTRNIAADNGCVDRIEIIQDLATHLTLSEKADVIIADLRGILPLFEQSIPSLIDARERLLAPGGILIPKQDTLWLAVVNAPNLYQYVQDPWVENRLGLNMMKGHSIVVNNYQKLRANPEQIVLPAQLWATLDYTTITDPNVKGSVTWTVENDTLAHGFNMWFEATLVDGVGFTTSPLEPELIYSTAFFPWLSPVTLQVGDNVTISLEARFVTDKYIWKWNTCIVGKDGVVKTDFKQSNFFSWWATSADLLKRAPNHIPSLNQEGAILRLVLNLTDGKVSNTTIAENLADEFPTVFPTKKEALAYISAVSLKYSE